MIVDQIILYNPPGTNTHTYRTNSVAISVKIRKINQNDNRSLVRVGFIKTPFPPIWLFEYDPGTLYRGGYPSSYC